jgi:DNA (cytosine-5)-methyltransferase 1
MADQAFLRTATRPSYETIERPIRVVDLFSGGGGLSLGVAEAARRVGRGTTIALAVEVDEAAADVYALNFPKADLRRVDVTTLFDGVLGATPTTSERVLAKAVGHVDVLVAGPPCQGHSDLNNHTRRRDPRNALYLRAIRAAEVLGPTYVLIENVPAIQHDKGKVLDAAVAALMSCGYRVADNVLDLANLGVPQRRRRHILLAVKGHQLDPDGILRTQSPCSQHAVRSVRWAIADLVGVTAECGPDSPSRPTAENLKRMRWLQAAPGRTDLPNSMRPECHRDKEHSYVSMYGRLSWEQPAQTITTGFGSMGQGRFVHPGLPRTLTPHEAARLQTLPDFYDLDASKGRGAWAMVIGNAVPPLLGVHLVEPLLCALPAETPEEVATEAPSATTTRRNGIPAASSDVIRTRMRTAKRRDTKPELALRSALHGLGLRFQVDRAINGNRGKIDVVFPSERVAVYVDGCFWHACPDHGTTPKANREWWVNKLANNKARDVATTEALTAEGWLVLRFWEHDDAVAAARTIYDHVQAIRWGRNGNGNGHATD